MEFQLPKEGLFDRKYLGMTAEEIYEVIFNETKSKLEKEQEEGESPLDLITSNFFLKLLNI